MLFAAGGGRSNNALFTHKHFAKDENFAWVIKSYFSYNKMHNFLLYEKYALQKM